MDPDLMALVSLAYVAYVACVFNLTATFRRWGKYFSSSSKDCASRLFRVGKHEMWCAFGDLVGRSFR
eukprot:626383-Prorocentrum_minimum.AAC.4